MDDIRVGDVVRYRRTIFQVHKIERGSNGYVAVGATYDHPKVATQAPTNELILCARALEESPIDEHECPTCGRMMGD